jgi:hypothetical protein
MPVPPSVVRRLRVTVGTKEPDVLDPVIGAISIDVVQSHVERCASPCRDPTLLAAILLDAGLDQAKLEIPSTASAVGHEHFLKRRFPRTGHDSAALDRLMPRCEIEAEARGALPDRKAAVIGALDLRPVVPSSTPAVSRNTQTAGVVRNCRLRQAEPSRDFDIGEPRPAEPTYFGTFLRCPDAARSRPRNNFAALRRIVPSSIGEAKSVLTLLDGMACLVIGANRWPVVLSAAVHRTYVPIRLGRNGLEMRKAPPRRGSLLTAGEGFEPSFPEPESGVLPARRPGISSREAKRRRQGRP